MRFFQGQQFKEEIGAGAGNAEIGGGHDVGEFWPDKGKLFVSLIPVQTGVDISLTADMSNLVLEQEIRENCPD